MMEREMTSYDDLSCVQDELIKCMKCGNCMAVCPVYLTEKSESGVTRGKISLVGAILNGTLDISDPDVEKCLFDCLACTSCMQNCPCGVQFSRIVFAARAAIVRKQGLNPVKRMIFAGMKNQRLLDSALKTAAVFQWMGLKKEKDTYIPRFPIGLALKRTFPGLSSMPFRDQMPPVIKPKTMGKTIKVAYFTGCSVNYVFPEIGRDVVKALTENNIEVVIPDKQQCCGMAVFSHGDVETARHLAKNNIDAMDDLNIDYIVTSCGSCGGAWQHLYPNELLAENRMYSRKAADWSQKTFDVSTLLVRIADKFKKPTGMVPAMITYHDSCHLRKVMKVYDEPREILRAIPGVDFREMAKADTCCGGGGSYMLTHQETSLKIVERKIKYINDTKAEIISTGCPGCMVQIMDGVKNFGGNQKTKHYVTLLAQSYSH